MKIKVFTPNASGKIEFTPAELEKLLNDTYAEGQQNCNCGSHLTWTSPYITPYINCNDSTTTNASTKGAPTTTTITLNSTEAQEMSKHIDEIIKTAAENNSVFSKLAKELNF